MSQSKINDLDPISAVLDTTEFAADDIGDTGETVKVTGTQLQSYVHPSTDPSFTARKNTAQVINSATPATILFNIEDHDSGGNYDNTTGLFTAPVAGDYLFTIQVTNDATSTAGDLFSIRLETTARNLIKFIRMDSIQTVSHSFSVFCQMSAADTAEVKMARTGGSGAFTFIINAQLHWFTGKLIK